MALFMIRHGTITTSAKTRNQSAKPEAQRKEIMHNIFPWLQNLLFLPVPLVGHGSVLAKWNQTSRVSWVSCTLSSARGGSGPTPEPPVRNAQGAQNTQDLVCVCVCV